MKNSRPSNVLIRVLLSILLLIAFFAAGALIYHASNQSRESDEGLGAPEQELLN